MTPRPKTEPTLGEWVVLGLLAEDPRHGWALARELAPDGPIGQVWTLSRPLVYRALDELVALGLADERRTVESAEGPRRTIHGATPKGRKALRAWLDEPVAHLRDVRTVLLAKLLLRQRLHLDARGFLVSQRRAIGPLVHALEAAQIDAAAGPDLIVARWRAETAETVVRFVDGLLADIVDAEAEADSEAAAAAEAAGRAHAEILAGPSTPVGDEHAGRGRTR
jgi:DNA-binding PadR family transcriptional regulator